VAWITLKEGRWAYEKEASSADGHGETRGPTRRRCLPLPTGRGGHSAFAGSPAGQPSPGNRSVSLYLIFMIPIALPFVQACRLRSRSRLALVGIDSHEVGRLGGTAYWVCLGAARGLAACRRQMGSVGGWPLARHLLSGGG
jgi:hypothetical protein